MKWVNFRFKRGFIRDCRASMAVAVIAIVTIPLTFIAWLVTWTPIAQMTDMLAAMTTNPDALRVYELAHNVAGWLLIAEVATVIVWWLASSFRQESQTYPKSGGKSYGY